MHLFFDTETSGLPNYKLPVDHPSQPHIVSLAAWLGEWQGDELIHVASVNSIIHPEGWHFDPAAVAVHLITEERARAVGEPLTDVLTRFFNLITLAAGEDFQHGHLIAHNHAFDTRMVLREIAHVGAESWRMNVLRPFCTMKALTPRMKLPSVSRFARPGDYKWPKLDEAYAWMFGGRPVPGRDDRHDAMADTLGCKDIYEEGRRREWWQ